MAHGVFKDLPRRTAADRVLSDKAFNIVKHQKYDIYQGSLASIVYKFFDQKAASGAANEIMQNKELTETLHRPIIKKSEKQKVYSSFIDIIWVLI